MIHVTQHAIERFVERVGGNADQARAALTTPFIEAAAKFGAKYVRLGTGHRVVIDQGRIITVLPLGHEAGRMHRYWERKVAKLAVDSD